MLYFDLSQVESDNIRAFTNFLDGKVIFGGEDAVKNYAVLDEDPYGLHLRYIT